MSVITVPGSELDINTPSTAVKLDAGALNARNRGTLAIAGAVEGLGDEAQQLGNDLAKVKMTTIAADADFRMRAAQHAFVKSTQGDPNDHDWDERAQQMAQKVKEDIYATHRVPPAMRPQLETTLRGWGQTLQIQAQTMAAVQSVHRAELAVETSFNEAGRDGSAEGMQNAVNMGKASKLDPVKMQSLEQSIPRTLAETAIDQGLNTNPVKTLELLKSGTPLPIKDQNGNDIDPKKAYTPQALERKIVYATQRAKEFQTANIQQLQASVGPDGFVPDEAIKQAIDQKTINPVAGKNLMLAQDRRVKALRDKDQAEITKDDQNAFYLLKSQINNQSLWQADPAGTLDDIVTRASGISNLAKRQEVINDANKQSAAIKKTGNLAQRPLETQIIELMRQDRETQGAMVPMAPKTIPAKTERNFPWTHATVIEPEKKTFQNVPGGIESIRKMKDDEFESLYGDKTTKDQVIDQINVHAAKLENDMREWFKSPEGQNATFDKANAHRMELEKPFVMEQTKQAITAPALAQPAARPPNAAFYSKSTGKWYDKDKKEIP